MRLSENLHTIKLGNWTFVLRPTLRAAFRLDQRYGGFVALSQAIADGNYTASADVIGEACTEPKAWTAYITSRNVNTLRELLAARDQLLEFILVLSGGDAKSGESQIGEPITFEEYHQRLFRIGTGWLHWTPETTWNATPSEILNGQAGLIEFMRAKYGSKESDDETIERTDGRLNDDTRAQLNALGDLSVTSTAQVR